MKNFYKFVGLIVLLVLTSCVRQPILKVVVVEPSSPLIVIDAGHGGKDDGCSNPIEEIDEKMLTLRVASYLECYLGRLGYSVAMTRSNDLFVSLKERVALANDINADLFVSVHFNGSKNAQAKGLEIFYYDDKENPERRNYSKELAEDVLPAIIGITGRKSRGVKMDNFCVIRETRMPAILIEGGFLTNPEEAEVVQKEEYIKSLAYGIASGIDKFVKENRPRCELNARPVA
ncbi:MAG: N-acetylmuramoyl-L-alanine amidase [Chlamydiae bacterium]|nr:N-acetylmuramoyl-L-alanine amidase [Chlamydiota bacterium]